jgi:hypothetical protein
MILKYLENVKKNYLGSSLLLPAYGWAGQGQYLLFWRRISQSKIRKIAAAEKRGRGGNSFPHTPFSSRPARALGWEAARLCVSKEAKPAKIVSLIVPPRRDCARPLKEKEIFAGFVSASVYYFIISVTNFSLSNGV